MYVYVCLRETTAIESLKIRHNFEIVVIGRKVTLSLQSDLILIQFMLAY
jgi:hypothetical protein